MQSPVSSGDLSRDILFKAAANQITIPGFSRWQIDFLLDLIDAKLDVKYEVFFKQFSLILQESNLIPLVEISQENTPTTSTSSQPIQPITVKKKKRNLKTRQQYKKRRMLRLTVSSQEVDQSDVKEVEHHTVEREDSKHVFLLRSQRDWSTCCWHAAAAIQSEVLIDGMIMMLSATNGRRRMGVG